MTTVPTTIHNVELTQVHVIWDYCKPQRHLQGERDFPCIYNSIHRTLRVPDKSIPICNAPLTPVVQLELRTYKHEIVQSTQEKQKHEVAEIKQLSKIESSIESIQGTPTVMIGGDFNLPTSEWTDGQPQNNGQMTTTLESFQARLLLTQVVNKATHRSGNILDVVFTNYRQMFNEINCIPTTFSDHFVVEITSHFKSHFAKAQQRSKQFFNKFDEHNFFSEDVQWDNIWLMI